MRTPRTVAFAFGALLAGCRMLGLEGPPERWEGTLIANAPYEDVWTVAILSLGRADFPPGDTDPVAGRARTGWYVDPYPYGNHGYRERAHLEVRREEGNWVRVRVRVERERNENAFQPLALDKAKWVRVEDSAERARFVVARVRAVLVGTGPSPPSVRRGSGEGS